MDVALSAAAQRLEEARVAVAEEPEAASGQDYKEAEPGDWSAVVGYNRVVAQEGSAAPDRSAAH